MTTPTDGAEFTELVDAHFPRVDLVDKAANGMRFLIAKRDEGQPGLFSPGYVRELLAKSEPELLKEMVTMTGSPAAIAKVIHDAAARAVASDQEATRPANAVVKETPEATAPGDLDPTVALAEPDETVSGDPNVPGSPAWEAVDAATATKWTAILARARRALDVLVERELLEPAAGDPGDYENVMDLGDAACAVDYAISLLAPFAVAEQADALTRDDRMAAVGKALHGWDPAPLDTIEGLTQVAKAGRVLSQANENAIRGAVDSLQKVLTSLPQAPTATDDGQPVTKQETKSMDIASPSAAAQALATAPAGLADGLAVAKTAEMPAASAAAVEPVEKAKTPQVAVYDKSGKLVGIVEPGDITMIADAEPDAPAEPAADEAVAEPAAPETPDLEPAPPAEVGTPADGILVDEDVTKTTTPTTDTAPDDELLKRSDVTAMITAALAERSDSQTELLARQAGEIGELTKSVETLTGLVKTLEEQPAAPKVFTQGAVPPSTALRGQDRGGPMAATIAQGQELKKSLYEAPDATAQNKIAVDMQALAIAQLAQIHGGN
ncbi:hypothetical protein [Streptomyces sp. NPDC005302]|uniref:hypothetical protein n=1 Tax=Streptomyces sp. NPDC005302 TaxID=3154675 RepID=UPI0033B2207F